MKDYEREERKEELEQERYEELMALLHEILAVLQKIEHNQPYIPGH